MADVYPTNLVEWMRRNGVASCTLSGDAITSLTLGDRPLGDDDKPQTQPTISPQERERREREQRRAVSMRSSGGPVKRLDEVD